MKKNTQYLAIINKIKHSQNLHNLHKSAVHLVSQCTLLTIILLLVIVGFNNVGVIKTAQARSTCGIVFTCPTPTTKPVLTPTPTTAPTPTPTTAPTPTPQPMVTPTPDMLPTPTPALQPVATDAALPGLAPTTTTDASPTVKATATPTRASQTPEPDATPTPIPHIGSQPGNQAGDSNFSHMLLIIGSVFLCLLIGLAVGLWFFRRKLLPPINFKRPASGVSSWTRTLNPDVANLNGNINNAARAENTFTTLEPKDYSADTIASSAIRPLPKSVRPNKKNRVAYNTTMAPNHPTQNPTSSWRDVSEEPFKS